MGGSEPRFDLEAYLERIGYRGRREPTLGTLELLHLAHLDRIPFENVDVRLGRPIALDLGSLTAKLVHGGRGGYCFEQNTLLAAALGALGFEVATLEARVRPPGVTAPLPRTHMLVRVDLEDRAWLADVGFGGDGPLAPVPLDGGLGEQPGGPYRVERQPDGTRVLRRRWLGEWLDLYAFTPVPALGVDFEVANHYTSTHPDSIFRRTLTVPRATPAARWILRGRSLTERRDGGEREREIATAELPALLAYRFGLEIPAADALAALG